MKILYQKQLSFFEGTNKDRINMEIVGRKGDRRERDMQIHYESLGSLVAA
jgi:hypothetical protein